MFPFMPTISFINKIQLSLVLKNSIEKYLKLHAKLYKYFFSDNNFLKVPNYH